MKTYLVVLLAALCAASGEALLSVGMKQVGDVSALEPSRWWTALRMFANAWVVGGVAVMAAFFFLYASALSWADFSFVQPLTSMSFVFGILIARFALGEAVSAWRWAGVCFIVAGVVLVSRDARQSTAAPLGREPSAAVGTRGRP